jgi:hypothetical protein
MKPGRKPKPHFDTSERQAFLSLLAEGFGIHQALREMGAGYERYRRTCRRVKHFRRDIAHTKASTLERLIHLRYQHATTDGHPEQGTALQFLIGRMDKREAFDKEIRTRLKCARVDGAVGDFRNAVEEAERRAEARKIERRNDPDDRSADLDDSN